MKTPPCIFQIGAQRFCGRAVFIWIGYTPSIRNGRCFFAWYVDKTEPILICSAKFCFHQGKPEPPYFFVCPVSFTQGARKCLLPPAVLGRGRQAFAPRGPFPRHSQAEPPADAPHKQRAPFCRGQKQAKVEAHSVQMKQAEALERGAFKWGAAFSGWRNRASRIRSLFRVCRTLSSQLCQKG